MVATFYDGTIAVVQGILKTLSYILHEAEKRPNASSLLDARLIEDMYPLTDQVRLAAQYSENLAARLTGREAVVYDRDVSTFAKCYERIETVLKVLEETDKDVVNQHSDVVAPAPFGIAKNIEVSGAAFAHTMVLPNIYFHLTTAYNILRKEGVPLGKRDFYVGFYPL
ncbi:hypothetical protein BP6252_01303 [Coleophoma cylindrospora]|uniref:DUF1993 domain-containing protein n=1 Tax=Coleophoma cylindrospora TaxID=1849047 RepID=A0A3D8SSX4_9HELO|nr:hypothetical protein BP6252_01303 [Coleophoma cylindrospora]